MLIPVLVFGSLTPSRSPAPTHPVSCPPVPLSPPHCICPHTTPHSNRSAALLKLNKLQKALADAEEATKLDPDFHKGWMRKGMVLESQGQHQEVSN